MNTTDAPLSEHAASAEPSRGSPEEHSQPPVGLVESLAQELHERIMREAVNRVTEEMTGEEAEAVMEPVLAAGLAAFRDVLNSMPGKLADAIDAQGPEVLTQVRRARRGFERRLRTVWGKAFDRLEVLRYIFVEFGESFLSEWARGSSDTGAPEPVNPLDLALTHLHARACRVAEEILVQLRAGLADGAHARWRTLHEIAVVTSVLVKGGATFAVRYWAHQQVQALRLARQLNDHAERLGWESLPSEEVERMKHAVGELVAQYGKGFRGDYGWADGFEGLKEPNLADLERALDVAHWRPFVGWASSSMHAGAKGLTALGGGLEPNPALLIPGPSNAGLADPGQNTALTLMWICAQLTDHRPNPDRSVALGAIGLLAERAQAEFVAAGELVEARTAELRARARHENPVRHADR